MSIRIRKRFSDGTVFVASVPKVKADKLVTDRMNRLKEANNRLINKINKINYSNYKDK
ncbi:hypothetical protein [Scopulibacillus cellulosilyticus]|uniref:Integrase-like protein n=1 Tax=Scopulibacillus cellulosilyticus TaxID=2665665 RepID=A0ABW2PYP3_9BACL